MSESKDGQIDYKASFHEAISQRDRLLADLKTAVNQLDHIVPTIDPQMDGNELEDVLNAVLSRANHTKDFLKVLIQEVTGGNDE